MTAPEEQPQEGEPREDEQFQLSAGWLIVGLCAIALGVACGLVMSSATLFR